jgi:MFS family permease
VRRTTLGVTVGLGVACILFGMVPGGLWLAFGFAGLRFLGQGSLMLNCANLVSQWFGRKRGFAMSLMALGFSLSMALHPPLAQWLINQVGWREAWLWLGVMTWLLLLPPVLLLVHDKPEQLGLLPDGDRTPPPAGRRSQSADFGLTLGEALRTPTFYIVAAGSFSLSMLVTMLHFFQVSIFESKGLSAQLGANVFALSALSMVCAMPVLGRMLDRFPTERMFAAGLVVMAGSLLAAANVHDLASSLIYGVVFGVNNAVTMTFFGFVWPRYFGRRHLGSIQGTGQMIGVVGASLGPLPLGLAEDLTGGYGTTLLALTALPLALAVLALFLREPRQMREA